MKNRIMAGVCRIFLISMVLLFIAGCTKHHADNITSGGYKNTASLMDSLVGSWKVTKVELPDVQAKLSSFTSQAEKDDMTRKEETYQAGLSNLITTLKADGTYESNLNGQIDLGTWTITEQRAVNTTSKLTNKLAVYELVKVKSNELTVRYVATDVVLLLTFIRK